MTHPLRPHHTKCAARDVEPPAQVADDEVEATTSPPPPTVAAAGGSHFTVTSASGRRSVPKIAA